MIIELDGKKPVIGKNVFIAPTATVIGNVVIGDNASVWYGVVIRGDCDRIVIGEKTNIQDNCTVHADLGQPTHIGDNVTVGHGCVIHGCTIDNECLVGMNAVVLNRAHIKKGSIVAAGSVITQGKEIGPFQLVAGVPAEVMKELAPQAALQRMDNATKDYLALSQLHQRAEIIQA